MQGESKQVAAGTTSWDAGLISTRTTLQACGIVATVIGIGRGSEAGDAILSRFGPLWAGMSRFERSRPGPPWATLSHLGPEWAGIGRKQI